MACFAATKARGECERPGKTEKGGGAPDSLENCASSKFDSRCNLHVTGFRLARIQGALGSREGVETSLTGPPRA
ncbi:uncharacterized protein FRV6_03295 [Fusarium oxysporum]|uniref:Uncharacterized protein n=1 Tax=Fusarium oxysporum TaxID=5507 RepID=A0A2H3SRL2_FUSOX|nr:uncharacterized protein FRV6_03295 [Fusarium oxysporum]